MPKRVLQGTVGDQVSISEHKPISKLKRWIVVENEKA